MTAMADWWMRVRRSRGEGMYTRIWLLQRFYAVSFT
jgi:hypothetical protein